MSYRNSCFISYRHPPSSISQRHEWIRFAEALESAISARLSVMLPTYRDIELQSNPGIKYTKALSERLCQSVCMIAILQPEYWESNWCMAEWQAMVQLEKLRLGKNSKEGLIIPIVYRGDHRQWSQHLGDRQPIELRILSPTQFKAIKYIRVVEIIAERINRLVREFKDPCLNCQEFQMSIVGHEEQVVLQAYKDQNPF